MDDVTALVNVWGGRLCSPAQQSPAQQGAGLYQRLSHEGPDDTIVFPRSHWICANEPQWSPQQAVALVPVPEQAAEGLKTFYLRFGHSEEKGLHVPVVCVERGGILELHSRGSSPPKGLSPTHPPDGCHSEGCEYFVHTDIANNGGASAQWPEWREGLLLATLGEIGAGVTRCTFISGWLMVDKDSAIWGEEGAGVMPGPQMIEFFGIEESASPVSLASKAAVAFDLAMFLGDGLLDMNSVVQFMLSGDIAFAMATSTGCLLSALQLSCVCYLDTRQFHMTPLGYLTESCQEAFAAGAMSRALMLFIDGEGFEMMITLIIVPYGLVALDRFEEWTVSIGVMVVSVMFAGRALSMWRDRKSEHLMQPARVKFMESQPGESLRRLAMILDGISWLPSLAVLASPIHGWLEDSKAIRWACLALYSLVAMSTQLLLLVLVPSRVSGRPILQITSCSCVQMKRDMRDPAFRLCRLLLGSCWQVGMAALVCVTVPGAPEYLTGLLDLSEYPPKPRTIVALIAIFATAASLLLWLLMFGLAQCTSLYPGLSFRRPVWPIRASTEAATEVEFQRDGYRHLQDKPGHAEPSIDA